MKLTRTKIGLIIASVYLGIFLITVLLAIFDNREGWGFFFPGLLAIPWSLTCFIFWKLQIKLPLVTGFIVIVSALINTRIIYYLFKRSDKDKKINK